jgi:hypothetical protein
MNNKPAARELSSGETRNPLLPDTNQAELETALLELSATRRECLRLRQLLREQDGKIAAIESSVIWRISAPARLIPQLRPHIKTLILLGILGVLSLPFLPMIALMMLVPQCRSFIWSLLSRAPRLLDLLMLIKSKLTATFSRSGSQASTAVALIYDRPTGACAETEQHEDASGLLRQLAPQKRFQLTQGAFVPRDIVSDIEDPAFTSLARTETSMLQLYTRASQQAVSGPRK